MKGSVVATPTCENLYSAINVERLENLLVAYTLGFRPVILEQGETCHRFDNFGPEQVIPDAFLSTIFFKLSFSLPMHPFFHDILEYYELDPLQLTPNSFRVVSCMYVLYDQTFYVPLSARELRYFYQLKDVRRKAGIFYLTTWNNRQDQCAKGNKRGIYDLQEMFLYSYDCDEIRKGFNMTPRKDLSLTYFFVHFSLLVFPSLGSPMCRSFFYFRVSKANPPARGRGEKSEEDC